MENGEWKMQNACVAGKLIIIHFPLSIDLQLLGQVPQVLSVVWPFRKSS